MMLLRECIQPAMRTNNDPNQPQEEEDQEGLVAGKKCTTAGDLLIAPPINDAKEK